MRSDFISLSRFHITVVNHKTGRFIKTITGYSPPKGKKLNLGVIGTDTEPPILIAAPPSLNNFDPGGEITLTFSEPIDPDTIKGTGHQSSKVD